MLNFITCSFMVLWLVGIILSAVRWRRSPRTAILTIIGLAIMIFSSLMEIVKNYLYSTYPNDLDISGALFVNMVRGLLIGQFAFEFVGWILIFLAIFSSVKKVNLNES